MAFDFPSSPTDGQTFTPPGGPTYRFVSPKWTVLGSSASVEISDTAPASPSPGNLWWEADTGKLFVWYSDGTSSQWVEAAGGGRGPAASGWRNRIINGDFAIDQRFNGAVATINATSIYGADRWYGHAGQAPGTFTMQRLADSAYLGEYFLSVGTGTLDASLAVGDYYLFGQRVEGFSVRDIGWGNAQAKPITISFICSVASGSATLPLSIRNAAQNRCWLGSFTATTTAQKITFSIPGDVTGTWAKDNTVGMDVCIGLGLGTTFQGVAGWQAGGLITLAGMTNFMGAANSFYLKDFQLEVGTQATEFERVPYDQQLARCQRYYEKWGGVTGSPFATGLAATATAIEAVLPFAIAKRASPTIVLSSPGDFKVRGSFGAPAASAVTAFGASLISAGMGLTIAGGTAGQGIYVQWTANAGYWAASAEL